MAKTLPALILTASLTFGCYDAPKVSMPTREEFKKEFLSYANLPTSAGVMQQQIIRDIDGNGTADLTHYGPNVYWIAQGVTLPAKYRFRDDAKTMTPEMRERLTRMMHDQQETAYDMMRTVRK